MYLLFHNDINPPLTKREILDFIFCPGPISTEPDEFGEYKMNSANHDLYTQYTTRHNIPLNWSKKGYQFLLKKTKAEIDRLKITINKRKYNGEYTGFLEIEFQSLLEKEIKLKKKIKSFSLRFDGPDRLAQAKRVPIDSILDFGGGNVIKCPFHPQKTGCFTLYRDQNRWWCYSCSTGGDVIDLVMKMQNITLPKAIEFLCRTIK